MIRTFGDGEEAKKQQKKVGTRLNSGAETDPQATDTQPEDIDPADFFDPEEFGYRCGIRHGR